MTLTATALAIRACIWRGLVTLTLTLLCIWGGPLLAAEITAVRLQQNDTYSRLVLELSKPADYQLFSIQGPDRLVIDFKSTRLVADIGAVDNHGRDIRRIRSGRRPDEGLRIVLDLTGHHQSRTFQLKPQEGHGHRLVVDLYPAEASPQSPATTLESLQGGRALRDIVVVIDPGHGGQDPGAIGPGQAREKDVVLQIARRVQQALNSVEGYRALLTRDGDYFVGLRQRAQHARRNNADLLVSIHADAFHNPRAKGASVYALSKNGATSEAAKWLADRENRADLIGGVGGVALSSKDDVLAGVLLDLSLTASMKASIEVGEHILGSMKPIVHLHKNRVEKAGFVVLKSPDVPSILVETGFISNPGEAARLRESAHQDRLAKAVVAGIQTFFEDAPPPGTTIAARRQRELSTIVYTTERGDTLSDIAARNKISVSQLKQANSLTRDTLRVGQKLIIPST